MNFSADSLRLRSYPAGEQVQRTTVEPSLAPSIIPVESLGGCHGLSAHTGTFISSDGWRGLSDGPLRNRFLCRRAPFCSLREPILKPRRYTLGEILDNVWLGATLAAIWGAVLVLIAAILFR